MRILSPFFSIDRRFAAVAPSMGNISMGSSAPIYLVSVPRSGATLLAAMLNSHKSITMFNEPWFFYMSQKYGTLQRRRNATMILDDLCAAAKSFGVLLDEGFKEGVLTTIYGLKAPKPLDAFAAFMESYASCMGKSRWGVKQPFSIFNIPKLLKYFPDLKVIHIIRDARATVAHRMGKTSNGRENLVQSLRFAKSWSNMIAQGALLTEVSPRNYFELKYEDMVSNQVMWLERICGFLNEEYDPKMTKYYEALNPYVPLDDNGKPAKSHEEVLLPVHTRDIEVWKSLLTQKETSIVERVCCQGMARQGYSPSTSNHEVGDLCFFLNNVRLKGWAIKRSPRRVLERIFHSSRKAFIFLTHRS